MSYEEMEFTHNYLTFKLHERFSSAMEFVNGISQEEVMRCDSVCLSEIIRHYAVVPPKLQTELIYVDEKIIESIDISVERKNGTTFHPFFIPVKHECEWFEEVNSQVVPSDGYPLAFLDKKRSRIRIVLGMSLKDTEGALKQKLDHRTDLLKRYADDVSSKILDFNTRLAEETVGDLNKRKSALLKADKELEALGLPRVYNPEHEEKAIKIHKLMQKLGEYMTNTNETGKRTSDIKSFIVHGHDDRSLLELKNYIQNTLKLEEPVILREQPGRGRTIIEKFEAHTEDVDLIFVLLTPDDEVVNSNDNNDVKRQARPNVIFEMGFFLGKLGRSSGKILLLHSGPMELPSDISGVEYIDISKGVESAGEKIRRELQALHVNV